MMARASFILLTCLLLMGCTKAPQTASQTLTGLDNTQVLIAAQHALALEGYDVEEINVESGTLTTTWQSEAPGLVQYDVQVTPKAAGDVATLEVKVSAKVKKKALGGEWSEPQVSGTADLNSILEDIVEKAVERYMPGEMAMAEPAQPKCSTTQECGAGSHCASGLCVSECSSAAECAEGNLCDTNGRCVPEPPPPCPELPVEEPEEPKKKKNRAEKKGGDK